MNYVGVEIACYRRIYLEKAPYYISHIQTLIENLRLFPNYLCLGLAGICWCCGYEKNHSFYILDVKDVISIWLMYGRGIPLFSTLFILTPDFQKWTKWHRQKWRKVPLIFKKRTKLHSVKKMAEGGKKYHTNFCYATFFHSMSTPDLKKWTKLQLAESGQPPWIYYLVTSFIFLWAT